MRYYGKHSKRQGRKGPGHLFLGFLLGIVVVILGFYLYLFLTA